MTVSDDLSALEKKPFADAVVKFEELLAQGGRRVPSLCASGFLT